MIVSSLKSAITHIADEARGEEVLTRCGRTLKNFQRGYSGTSDCKRCGSTDDFEQVREEARQMFLENKKKRELANRERRERTNQRLETHRRLMEGFKALLKEAEVQIIETKWQPAGGSIEFEAEGLKFKLSGNIF